MTRSRSAGPPPRSRRDSRASRCAGCASCSSSQPSSMAFWSRARRWRTSPVCSERGAGGPSATASTSSGVGLAGAPRPRILTSGYVHPTAVQALDMLGMGRDNVTRLARDGVGRLDLGGLEAELRTGEPAIVIANAGEVNNGDFDPIAADRRADPRARRLAARRRSLRAVRAPRPRVPGADRRGRVRRLDHGRRAQVAERALRLRDRVRARPRAPGGCVPHRRALPPRARRPAAEHELAEPGELAARPRPRGLGDAARLRARRLPNHGRAPPAPRAPPRRRRSTAEPELELLAEPQLNIVCFRARPAGVPEAQLDDLNRRLGEALLADGRVYCGTTVYDGRVAFRPAIVNWQTTEADVEALVEVLIQLVKGERG